MTTTTTTMQVVGVYIILLRVPYSNNNNDDDGVLKTQTAAMTVIRQMADRARKQVSRKHDTPPGPGIIGSADRRRYRVDRHSTRRRLSTRFQRTRAREPMNE